jgi:hypothetical protein
MFVHERLHFFMLIAATMFATLAELGRPPPALGDMVTTGEGGGCCKLDPAAGGFELRLITSRSDGGVAKDGGGASIGSDKGWA